jgi:DNA-binding transcriptional ArsR family regulator
VPPAEAEKKLDTPVTAWKARLPSDPAALQELLDQAHRASEMLKALSHETRLLILCLLSEGEKSVSELEDTLSMSQAAVSQQLARLRFDRLVKTRRDGRSIYYSIADEEVAALIGALYDIFCRKVREQPSE